MNRHFDILDALLEGNVEKAALLMKKHVQRARMRYMQYWFGVNA